HHHAGLESGARVPPHCVEAAHFRLRAVQAISDCSHSRRHQAPLLQDSAPIAKHAHVQASGLAYCSWNTPLLSRHPPNYRLNGPLREARRSHPRDAPIPALWPEQYAAPRRCTFSLSARRTTPAIYVNLQRGKWLQPVDTTGRYFVSAICARPLKRLSILASFCQKIEVLNC